MEVIFGDRPQDFFKTITTRLELVVVFIDRQPHVTSCVAAPRNLMRWCLRFDTARHLPKIGSVERHQMMLRPLQDRVLTLGPKGRNGVLDKSYGVPHVRTA
jgi:hypothetical protein